MLRSKGDRIRESSSLRSGGRARCGIERKSGGAKKRGLASWDAQGGSRDGSQDAAGQIARYNNITTAEEVKTKPR